MLFKPETFFDLASFKHKSLFDCVENVWEVFFHLKSYIEQQNLGSVQSQLSSKVELIHPKRIYLGKKCQIGSFVTIEGPCYIGDHCEIAPGAYIRAYSFVGDFVKVGHCSEIKHSILLPFCKAPHFNYVGDSILGFNVNLGAGVVLANYKLNGSDVVIRASSKKIKTHLNKLGAIIGDASSIGCNSVLNPGTLVKKGFKCRALSELSGLVENSKKD